MNQKKARGLRCGLNLFPLKEIEETGSMMLQRGKDFQFILVMVTIMPANMPARRCNRALLGASEKMFYDCKICEKDS